jgi:hypothetical protein
MSGDGWDELEQRAQQSADSGGTPPEWGKKVDLEVGETFRGRHRDGYQEGGRSGALLWDEDGEPRFIWANASLRRDYDREEPNLGDDVAIENGELPHPARRGHGRAVGEELPGRDAREQVAAAGPGPAGRRRHPVLTVDDRRPDELLDPAARVAWRLGRRLAWTDELTSKRCSRSGSAAWKEAAPLHAEEGAARGFFVVPLIPFER